MREPSSFNPWTAVAATLFVLATLMGAGPGLLLINPPADAPKESFFVLGMPRIYAWAVGWFVLQATALGIAYTKVWKS